MRAGGMKLKSRQDIAVPCEDVFARLTDFAAFERRAISRGASVRRLDEPPVSGAGAEWEVRFRLRGRERVLHLILAECDAPSRLAFTGISRGFNFESTAELIPLSRQDTRMAVVLDAKARSLAGRMALRSLSLVRGATQRRFDTAVARFAQEIAAGF